MSNLASARREFLPCGFQIGRGTDPGFESGSIRKEPIMSVAKFIEISSESSKSFEDAIQLGITKAAETLHNVRSAWIKEQEVLIENGKASRFRVIMKVAFVLE